MNNTELLASFDASQRSHSNAGIAKLFLGIGTRSICWKPTPELCPTLFVTN